MAIVRENYVEDDGRIFVRTYSDAGFVIEQVGTGCYYAEAIDPHHLASERLYIETSDPIELDMDAIMYNDEENPAPGYSSEDFVEAAKILLGEEE